MKDDIASKIRPQNVKLHSDGKANKKIRSDLSA